MLCNSQVFIGRWCSHPMEDGLFGARSQGCYQRARYGRQQKNACLLKGQTHFLLLFGINHLSKTRSVIVMEYLEL